MPSDSLMVRASAVTVSLQRQETGLRSRFLPHQSRTETDEGRAVYCKLVSPFAPWAQIMPWPIGQLLSAAYHTAQISFLRMYGHLLSVRRYTATFSLLLTFAVANISTRIRVLLFATYRDCFEAVLAQCRHVLELGISWPDGLVHGDL